MSSFSGNEVRFDLVSMSGSHLEFITPGQAQLLERRGIAKCDAKGKIVQLIIPNAKLQNVKRIRELVPTDTEFSEYTQYLKKFWEKSPERITAVFQGGLCRGS